MSPTLKDYFSAEDLDNAEYLVKKGTMGTTIGPHPLIPKSAKKRVTDETLASTIQRT